MPIPPAGTASPSRIARSMVPLSICCTTTGSVATSTYSASGRSGCGRRPRARITCDRMLASSLYTRILSGSLAEAFVTRLTLPGRAGPISPSARRWWGTASRLRLQPAQPSVLALPLPHRRAHPLREQHREQHQPDEVAGGPQDAPGDVLVG